ncbi:MAG: hypothetical protein EOO43_24595, partial [Flavobacterium sp.]
EIVKSILTSTNSNQSNLVAEEKQSYGIWNDRSESKRRLLEEDDQNEKSETILKKSELGIERMDKEMTMKGSANRSIMKTNGGVFREEDWKIKQNTSRRNGYSEWKERLWSVCPILSGGSENGEDSVLERKVKQEFNDYLEKRNMMLYDVKGDGNCLYYAICDQIAKRGENNTFQRFFREVVAEEIGINRERYVKFLGEKVDEHKEKVLIEGYWGEFADIQAISNAMGWTVFVFWKKANEQIQEEIIQPENGISTKTLHILYSAELEHYMSTRAIMDNKLSEQKYETPSGSFGQGGSGVVQLAFDILNSRIVAIKEISQESMSQATNRRIN